MKALVLGASGQLGQALQAVLEREGSKTKGELQEVILGGADYKLVSIPPGIWNGFTGTAATPSIVANCPTEPHDPEEIVRIDPHSEKIPYDWTKGPRG